VFERLLLMDPDPHAVTTAVEMVLNQRLLRRVCAACAGRGCTTCLNTGFRGRIPVVESIRVDTSLRQRLRRSGPRSSSPDAHSGRGA
jgi:type II secretory ATPase GspE/PulE/Tfp pilus assembly ATPase PilB-like protein